MFSSGTVDKKYGFNYLGEGQGLFKGPVPLSLTWPCLRVPRLLARGRWCLVLKCSFPSSRDSPATGLVVLQQPQEQTGFSCS